MCQAALVLVLTYITYVSILPVTSGLPGELRTEPGAYFEAEMCTFIFPCEPKSASMSEVGGCPDIPSFTGRHDERIWSGRGDTDFRAEATFQ